MQRRPERTAAGDSRLELLRGTLDMLILRVVSRGDLHGYGIAQRIRQLSSDVLQVEEGSLYPALQRLQVKGWIKGEWRITEKNRRARFYRITPAGRKRLQADEADFGELVAAITRVMRTA